MYPCVPHGRTKRALQQRPIAVSFGATGTSRWACVCSQTDYVCPRTSRQQMPSEALISQLATCPFCARAESSTHNADTSAPHSWRCTRSACLLVNCGCCTSSSKTYLSLLQLLHGSQKNRSVCQIAGCQRRVLIDSVVIALWHFVLFCRKAVCVETVKRVFVAIGKESKY